VNFVYVHYEFVFESSEMRVKNGDMLNVETILAYTPRSGACLSRPFIIRVVNFYKVSPLFLNLCSI
jgi:hypothetical protein